MKNKQTIMVSNNLLSPMDKKNIGLKHTVNATNALIVTNIISALVALKQLRFKIIINE
jgi:hypothetical protein